MVGSRWHPGMCVDFTLEIRLTKTTVVFTDDPEFPKYKANYREFLNQRAKFVQPIAIDDLAIQRKIHHTYRLQYLKDVILGRALDDSTFNVLNSSIIFNQIDIINHVQQDEKFLRDLVGLFLPRSADSKVKGKDKDVGAGSTEVHKPSGSKPSTINGVNSDHNAGPSSSPTDSTSPNDLAEKKKEVILLLQQLCAMGKNVQLPARVNLFRALMERGILYAVQWALCQSERSLVSIAGEVLAVLLDHQTVGVRQHIMCQAATLEQSVGGFGREQDMLALQRHRDFVMNNCPPPFKETLAQVLSRMLSNSVDLALQNQLADALRALLEVPQTDGLPDSHVSRQLDGLTALTYWSTDFVVWIQVFGSTRERRP